ncbi:MAG: hypothetical protein PHP06_10170 [Clostridia bacterium]|nr:hypothetical protein [Clostridia bacterium]
MLTANTRRILIIFSIAVIICFLAYLGFDLYTQFYFGGQPSYFNVFNSMVYSDDENLFIDMKWHPLKDQLVVLKLNKQDNIPEIFQIDANTKNISSKLEPSEIKVFDSIDDIKIHGDKVFCYFNTDSGPIIIYFDNAGKIELCEYYNQKGVKNFTLSSDGSILCYTDSLNQRLKWSIFVKTNNAEQVSKVRCFPDKIYHIDENNCIYFSSKKRSKHFNWISLNDLHRLCSMESDETVLNSCLSPIFRNDQIAYWRYMKGNLSLWLKNGNKEEIKIDEFKVSKNNNILPGLSWVPRQNKIAYISYSDKGSSLNVFDIDKMITQTIVDNKELCGPIKFSSSGKYILYSQIELDGPKINILEDGIEHVDITDSILNSD